MYFNDIEMSFPDRLQLEISPKEQKYAWEQAQNYSNKLASYNAYLNYVCLHTVFNWLKDWLAEESLPAPSIYQSENSLFSLWEFVNGAAIEMGKKRIVLIPSETDLEDLCVPQEWVDIPSFAGDCYLAVQVNLEALEDECFLRFCGFTTHSQLKNLGKYNPNERNYVLAFENLITNFSLMEVALELQSLNSIPELPALSEVDAQKLVEILGNKSIYSPRLRVDIPFEQWAALLNNEKWRYKLYELRVKPLVSNRTETLKTTNYLSNWFKNIFETGWESLDTVLNPEAVRFAFRNRDFTSQNSSVERVKLIDKGILLGNQSVALLVGVVEENETSVRIRIQLHPASGQTYLPLNIRLAFLSQSGETHKEVISRSQDNMIQLPQFTCPKGKSFKIQVAVEHFNVVEDFTV